MFQRQLEREQKFFKQFRSPFDIKQTEEPSSSMAQVHDRARLLRILNSAVRAGHLKPTGRKSKNGVVMLSYAISGFDYSEIHISYLPSAPGAVMFIKQGYRYRSYGHRINSAGIY